MQIFKNGLDSLLDSIEQATRCAFEGAEEIGTSDVSCVVRDILRRFYDNPEQASPEEFHLVRNGVQNAISELFA